MPFCTRCGTNVDDRAFFCPHCGSPQNAQAQGPAFGGGAAYASSQPGPDFLSGIGNRTASVLCYVPVFGVIPAIVFLASQRFRTDMRVRFDGFQSLYLFVGWLIVTSAAPTIFFSGGGFGLERLLLGLLKLAVFLCWVYLLINAAQQRQIRLPIVGDLAARSTTEQL